MSRFFTPDEADSIWGSCWYGPLEFLQSFPSPFTCTLLVSLTRVLRICRMLVFSWPRKSPRAWKSIGVGAGFDVKVLHTTSLLSGFCSEAERSHLGPSREYFQLLALSLQGPWSSKLLMGFFLKPRLPRARPYLCCPLLGWPALIPCLSAPCFFIKDLAMAGAEYVTGGCQWNRLKPMCLEVIKLQISYCS